MFCVIIWGLCSSWIRNERDFVASCHIVSDTVVLVGWFNHEPTSLISSPIQVNLKSSDKFLSLTFIAFLSHLAGEFFWTVRYLSDLTWSSCTIVPYCTTLPIVFRNSSSFCSFSYRIVNWNLLSNIPFLLLFVTCSSCPRRRCSLLPASFSALSSSVCELHNDLLDILWIGNLE